MLKQNDGHSFRMDLGSFKASSMSHAHSGPCDIIKESESRTWWVSTMLDWNTK